MDVASSYTADVDHLDDDGASVLPREDFKRGLAPVESDLSEPSEPVIKLSPSAVQLKIPAFQRKTSFKDTAQPFRVATPDIQVMAEEGSLNV